MNRHFKKALAFVLAFSLVFTLVTTPPILAEEVTVPAAGQHLFEDGVITYIDEKFDADSCPTGWAGGDAFTDGVATITKNNLRYNGDAIPDSKNYTVSAEFTITSTPTANAYYTLSIARYDASQPYGIECAIVWNKDGSKWRFRVMDRRTTAATDTTTFLVSETDLPSTVGADFNTPITMEASIYNNRFSFFVNGVCLASQVLPEIYNGGGLFSFWSQGKNPLTIDNVKVTGYKTDGRNKLLVDDLCSYAPSILPSVNNMFYAYNGGSLSGVTTNPYYHSGTGMQVEADTPNKTHYVLKNAEIYYAAEDALSWKNYNVEATLQLAVKQPNGVAGYDGTTGAGVVFGSKQNAGNSAMRNLGVSFIVYYQYDEQNGGTFTYKVTDIDNNRTVRKEGNVPPECELTFDKTEGSSVFTVRASIFDNTVFCYINDKFVCKAVLNDTVMGTCGICMTSTTFLTNILGFKVVGEYPTEKPELEDNVIFFEDFNDRTRGKMTTSGAGLWDFSNQAAITLETNDARTIGYFNEESYAWRNCIYEADYKFTSLPKTYEDLERGTPGDYPAYYTFALTDGGNTTDSSVLEFRLLYLVKSSSPQDNYWRMELYLRGEGSGYYAGQGLENKSAAVTLDASNPAVRKLSNAETVKFKIITRGGKLVAIYFDDYKAPFSDSVINEYNAYTGNNVHGAPLYSMLSRAKAEWVIDNIKVTHIPDVPKSTVYDFNNGTYKVGDKPISLFDGWDSDSDNEIVELENGTKALKADNTLKWYGDYDNVRASFTFSVKGNLDKGEFNSIDYFPRLQMGNWASAAVGLRTNYSGLAFNDTPYFQALYDLRSKDSQARSDAAAEGKLPATTQDANTYITGLLLNYYLTNADGFKAQNADGVHVFTITKIGGYYKTEIDGKTVGEHMANKNDYSSCLLGALPVVFEVGANEGRNEDKGIAIREKTTYVHKIEIEDLTEKLRTVGLSNDFELIELPSANIAGLPSGEKFTSARENAFLAGDTVAIRANEGVKIKAGSLKYVDENTNTGNIFLSANGKLGDGRSFIFTMPDYNVSIVYDSMGGDTLSFAVIAASRSLIDDDDPSSDHAVRFLHRVYLGGRIGNGYSSSVVYEGEKYTITDIGAVIVPKDVFDDEFNEDSLLNSDYRIMKVSLFDHGKLYDSTDEYIDFTLRMTGIPRDDRMYRCCTYVKLKDGDGNEKCVFGNVREASFDSLE